MLKISTFSLILALGSPLAAQAADPQAVVTVTSVAARRQQVAQAAEALCHSVREQDVANDYGSQEDCVNDALAHAHPVQPGLQLSQT